MQKLFLSALIDHRQPLRRICDHNENNSVTLIEAVDLHDSPVAVIEYHDADGTSKRDLTMPR